MRDQWGWWYTKKDQQQQQKGAIDPCCKITHVLMFYVISDYNDGDHSFFNSIYC